MGYGTDVVLDGIDVSVSTGGALVLLGPNGAGKTTLLRAVLGLVPLRAGTIRVLGRSPVQARADIGYVPQAGTLDRDFPVSVGEVVAMGRYRRIGWVRRPGPVDRELVARALVQVGLAERAHDRFGTLSGGQRQRVLLARAVAQQARLLLLDEPFNGVDATNRELILEALSSLRAAGASIVMATHDLGVLRLGACECCLLDRGLHALGHPEDVLCPGPVAYGREVPVADDDQTAAPCSSGA